VRRRPTLQTLLAAALILAAIGVAGCGSSSHSKSHTTNASSATPTTATGTRTTAVAPSKTIVTVAGAPITLATFLHWLTVTTATNETGNQAGAIVPDPPNFTNCMAAAGKLLASKHPTQKQLLADCEGLYRADSEEALDFLIKADWLQAAGTKAGVVPSEAAVLANFKAEKAQEFKSATTYAQFLATTKQTEADILLKIKSDRIETLLAKKDGGDKKLEEALTKAYQPLTECTANYIIPDCANYVAPKTG
jgi:hypothetical protein